MVLITLGGDSTALIDALSSTKIHDNFLNRGLFNLLLGKHVDDFIWYLPAVQLDLVLAQRAIQEVECDSLSFSTLIDPLVDAGSVEDVKAD